MVFQFRTPCNPLHADVSHLGDVLHLQILSQHFIVLNSPEANAEFMDKKTSNTSDRLVTPVVRLYVLSSNQVDLDYTLVRGRTGNEWIMGLMPYGPWWRNCRRAFWQHFHPGVIGKYHPVQLVVARQFLLKLLRDPANSRKHIRLYALHYAPSNAELTPVQLLSWD